jgi:hypothetical protein
MTLEDLAELASKRVEGFKRPMSSCRTCQCWTRIRESDCPACKGGNWALDNSPAALAMAVLLFVAKCPVPSEVSVQGRSVLVMYGKTASTVMNEVGEESIARALLTALLRAHGVGVADA